MTFELKLTVIKLNNLQCVSVTLYRHKHTIYTVYFICKKAFLWHFYCKRVSASFRAFSISAACCEKLSCSCFMTCRVFEMSSIIVWISWKLKQKKRTNVKMKHQLHQTGTDRPFHFIVPRCRVKRGELEITCMDGHRVWAR